MPSLANSIIIHHFIISDDYCANKILKLVNAQWLGLRQIACAEEQQGEAVDRKDGVRMIPSQGMRAVIQVITVALFREDNVRTIFSVMLRMHVTGLCEELVRRT